MKVFAEVHVPGRYSARCVLPSGICSIGTSRQTSVVLPPATEFPAERLELRVDDHGVFIVVPDRSCIKLVFDGIEHSRVHVPFGREVYISRTRLAFVKDSPPRRPLLLLTGPLILIALGLATYGTAPVDAAQSEVPTPPLFSIASSPLCQGDLPDTARDRAMTLERAADAKDIRSVFDLRDALEATRLWEQSLSCYRVAADAAAQDRLSRRLQASKRRLTAQYATLRVRLKLALDTNRVLDALSATRDLQALLSDKSSEPYQQWLARLAKSLEQRIRLSGR